MGNILLRLLMRSRSWVTLPVSEARGEGGRGRLQVGPISTLYTCSPFLLHCAFCISWHSGCYMPIDMLLAFDSFRCKAGEYAERLGDIHTPLVLTSCMRDEAESEFCAVYRRQNEFHMLTMEAAHVCTVRTFPVSIFNFHAKCSLH